MFNFNANKEGFETDYTKPLFLDNQSNKISATRSWSQPSRIVRARLLARLLVNKQPIPIAPRIASAPRTTFFLNPEYAHKKGNYPVWFRFQPNIRYRQSQLWLQYRAQTLRFFSRYRVGTFISRFFKRANTPSPQRRILRQKLRAQLKQIFGRHRLASFRRKERFVLLNKQLYKTHNSFVGNSIASTTTGVQCNTRKINFFSKDGPLSQKLEFIKRHPRLLENSPQQKPTSAHLKKQKLCAHRWRFTKQLYRTRVKRQSFQLRAARSRQAVKKLLIYSQFFNTSGACLPNLKKAQRRRFLYEAHRSVKSKKIQSAGFNNVLSQLISLKVAKLGCFSKRWGLYPKGGLGADRRPNRVRIPFKLFFANNLKKRRHNAHLYRLRRKRKAFYKRKIRARWRAQIIERKYKSWLKYKKVPHRYWQQIWRLWFYKKSKTRRRLRSSRRFLIIKQNNKKARMQKLFFPKPNKKIVKLKLTKSRAFFGPRKLIYVKCWKSLQHKHRRRPKNRRRLRHKRRFMLKRRRYRMGVKNHKWRKYKKQKHKKRKHYKGRGKFEKIKVLKKQVRGAKRRIRIKAFKVRKKLKKIHRKLRVQITSVRLKKRKKLKKKLLKLKKSKKWLRAAKRSAHIKKPQLLISQYYQKYTKQTKSLRRCLLREKLQRRRRFDPRRYWGLIRQGRKQQARKNRKKFIRTQWSPTSKKQEQKLSSFYLKEMLARKQRTIYDALRMIRTSFKVTSAKLPTKAHSTLNVLRRLILKRQRRITKKQALLAPVYAPEFRKQHFPRHFTGQPRRPIYTRKRELKRRRIWMNALFTKRFLWPPRSARAMFYWAPNRLGHYLGLTPSIGYRRLQRAYLSIKNKPSRLSAAPAFFHVGSVKGNKTKWKAFFVRKWAIFSSTKQIDSKSYSSSYEVSSVANLASYAPVWGRLAELSGKTVQEHKTAFIFGACRWLGSRLIEKIINNPATTKFWNTLTGTADKEIVIRGLRQQLFKHKPNWFSIEANSRLSLLQGILAQSKQDYQTVCKKYQKAITALQILDLMDLWKMQPYLKNQLSARFSYFFRSYLQGFFSYFGLATTASKLSIGSYCATLPIDKPRFHYIGSHNETEYDNYVFAHTLRLAGKTRRKFVSLNFKTPHSLAYTLNFSASLKSRASKNLNSGYATQQQRYTPKTTQYRIIQKRRLLALPHKQLKKAPTLFHKIPAGTRMSIIELLRRPDFREKNNECYSQFLWTIAQRSLLKESSSLRQRRKAKNIVRKNQAFQRLYDKHFRQNKERAEDAFRERRTDSFLLVDELEVKIPKQLKQTFNFRSGSPEQHTQLFRRVTRSKRTPYTLSVNSTLIKPALPQKSILYKNNTVRITNQKDTRRHAYSERIRYALENRQLCAQKVSLRLQRNKWKLHFQKRYYYKAWRRLFRRTRKTVLWARRRYKKFKNVKRRPTYFNTPRRAAPSGRLVFVRRSPCRYSTMKGVVHKKLTRAQWYTLSRRKRRKILLVYAIKNFLRAKAVLQKNKILHLLVRACLHRRSIRRIPSRKMRLRRYSNEIRINNKIRERALVRLHLRSKLRWRYEYRRFLYYSTFFGRKRRLAQIKKEVLQKEKYQKPLQRALLKHGFKNSLFIKNQPLSTLLKDSITLNPNRQSLQLPQVVSSSATSKFVRSRRQSFHSLLSPAARLYRKIDSLRNLRTARATISKTMNRTLPAQKTNQISQRLRNSLQKFRKNIRNRATFSSRTGVIRRHRQYLKQDISKTVSLLPTQSFRRFWRGNISYRARLYLKKAQIARRAKTMRRIKKVAKLYDRIAETDYLSTMWANKPPASLFFLPPNTITHAEASVQVETAAASAAVELDTEYQLTATVVDKIRELLFSTVSFVFRHKYSNVQSKRKMKQILHYIYWHTRIFISGDDQCYGLRKYKSTISAARLRAEFILKKRPKLSAEEKGTLIVQTQPQRFNSKPKMEKNPRVAWLKVFFPKRYALYNEDPEKYRKFQLSSTEIYAKRPSNEKVSNWKSAAVFTQIDARHNHSMKRGKENYRFDGILATAKRINENKDFNLHKRCSAPRVNFFSRSYSTNNYDVLNKIDAILDANTAANTTMIWGRENSLVAQEQGITSDSLLGSSSVSSAAGGREKSAKNLLYLTKKISESGGSTLFMGFSEKPLKQRPITSDYFLNKIRTQPQKLQRYRPGLVIDRIKARKHYIVTQPSLINKPSATIDQRLDPYFSWKQLRKLPIKKSGFLSATYSARKHKLRSCAFLGGVTSFAQQKSVKHKILLLMQNTILTKISNVQLKKNRKQAVSTARKYLFLKKISKDRLINFATINEKRKLRRLHQTSSLKKPRQWKQLLFFGNNARLFSNFQTKTFSKKNTESVPLLTSRINSVHKLRSRIKVRETGHLRNFFRAMPRIWQASRLNKYTLSSKRQPRLGYQQQLNKGYNTLKQIRALRGIQKLRYDLKKHRTAKRNFSHKLFLNTAFDKHAKAQRLYLKQSTKNLLNRSAGVQTSRILNKRTNKKLIDVLASKIDSKYSKKSMRKTGRAFNVAVARTTIVLQNQGTWRLFPGRGRRSRIIKSRRKRLLFRLVTQPAISRKNLESSYFSNIHKVRNTKNKQTSKLLYTLGGGAIINFKNANQIKRIKVSGLARKRKKNNHLIWFRRLRLHRRWKLMLSYRIQRVLGAIKQLRRASKTFPKKQQLSKKRFRVREYFCGRNIELFLRRKTLNLLSKADVSELDSYRNIDFPLTHKQIKNNITFKQSKKIFEKLQIKTLRKIKKANWGPAPNTGLKLNKIRRNIIWVKKNRFYRKWLNKKQIKKLIIGFRAPRLCGQTRSMFIRKSRRWIRRSKRAVVVVWRQRRLSIWRKYHGKEKIKKLMQRRKRSLIRAVRRCYTRHSKIQIQTMRIKRQSARLPRYLVRRRREFARNLTVRQLRLRTISKIKNEIAGQKNMQNYNQQSNNYSLISRNPLTTRLFYQQQRAAALSYVARATKKLKKIIKIRIKKRTIKKLAVKPIQKKKDKKLNRRNYKTRKPKRWKIDKIVRTPTQERKLTKKKLWKKSKTSVLKSSQEERRLQSKLFVQNLIESRLLPRRLAKLRRKQTRTKRFYLSPRFNLQLKKLKFLYKLPKNKGLILPITTGLSPKLFQRRLRWKSIRHAENRDLRYNLLSNFESVWENLTLLKNKKKHILKKWNSQISRRLKKEKWAFMPSARFSKTKLRLKKIYWTEEDELSKPEGYRWYNFLPQQRKSEIGWLEPIVYSRTLFRTQRHLRRRKRQKLDTKKFKWINRVIRTLAPTFAQADRYIRGTAGKKRNRGIKKWPRLKMANYKFQKSMFNIRNVGVAQRHFKKIAKHRTHSDRFANTLRGYGNRMDVTLVLMNIAPTPFWARAVAKMQLLHVNGIRVNENYMFQPNDLITFDWKKIKLLQYLMTVGRENIFTKFSTFFTPKTPANMSKNILFLPKTRQAIYQRLPNPEDLPKNSRLNPVLFKLFTMDAAANRPR